MSGMEEAHHNDNQRRLESIEETLDKNTQATSALVADTTDAEMWYGVSKQFAAVNLRLSSQDVAIDSLRSQIMDNAIADATANAANAAIVSKIAEDTSAMLAAWNDGVATKRFFCRLAEVWKFMYRHLLIPLAIPGVMVYSFLYYTEHGQYPKWVSAIFKAFF